MHAGNPQAYYTVAWTKEDERRAGVKRGDPAGQSYWEFLNIALAMDMWADEFTQRSLTLLGDSTAALQDFLDMKGNTSMLPIAREVAWRRQVRRWQFQVAHLPKEQNVLADALSRMSQPGTSSALPPELAGASRVHVCTSTFWHLL